MRPNLVPIGFPVGGEVGRAVAAYRNYRFGGSEVRLSLEAAMMLTGDNAGTDVAMESADVVLMKSDPYDIVAAIELLRATLRKMHQNLWGAVGYNVIAFPLAAGVLYPFVLSPAIAALSMSGSSAVVAINALLLKRTKLAGIHRPGKPGKEASRDPAIS